MLLGASAAAGRSPGGRAPAAGDDHRPRRRRLAGQPLEQAAGRGRRRSVRPPRRPARPGSPSDRRHSPYRPASPGPSAPVRQAAISGCQPWPDADLRPAIERQPVDLQAEAGGAAVEQGLVRRAARRQAIGGKLPGCARSGAISASFPSARRSCQMPSPIIVATAAATRIVGMSGKRISARPFVRRLPGSTAAR